MGYVLMIGRGVDATAFPDVYGTQEWAYVEACRYAGLLGVEVFIYSEDTQVRYVTVYPGSTPEDFETW